MNKKIILVLIAVCVIILFVFIWQKVSPNSNSNLDIVYLKNGEIDVKKTCGRDTADYSASICFTAVALEKKSVEVCKSIPLADDQDYCIKELARETKDASLCKQSSYDIAVCEMEVAKVNNVAKALIGGYVGCDSLSFYQDKEKCFSDLGIALNDPQLCEKATSFDRVKCYNRLAMQNVDIDYCKNNYDFGNWGEVCSEEVSYAKEKIAVCSDSVGADAGLCKDMVIGIILEAEKVIPGFNVYGGAAGDGATVYRIINSRCADLSADNVVVKKQCNNIVSELNSTIYR